MKSIMVGAACFVAGVILASVYFMNQEVEQPKEQPVCEQKSEAVVPPVDKVVDPSSPCFGFSYEKLTAPKYASGTPPTIQTNRMMEAKVTWDGVNGARGYILFLETPGGKLIRKYETKKTSILLRDIPLPIEAKEADYVVRIATINGADKVGEKGDPRPLKVNRMGSVMAPTLKKIEVED